MLARSLDHHDGRQALRVFQPPPRGHVADGVGAEDQEQTSLRSAKGVQGVGGDGRPLAVDLERARFQAVDGRSGRFDHGVTIGGSGVHLVSLLPRISGRNEKHAVELTRSPRLGGGGHMTHMGRVEGPAEDPDPFHTSSLRTRIVHTAATLPGRMAPTLTRMVTGIPVLVRIWLPDRPGALGLVASRIGALRGDIVGVDVLERGEGVAVDEVAVILPDRDVLDMLVHEIEEVDGVSVEEVRDVATFPDPRLDAIEGAARLVEATSVPDLCATLVEQFRREFLADWSALLADDVLSTAGDAPVREVILALASGTTASPSVADGTTGPDDLAVALLPVHGATVLVGRSAPPLRRRERAQLHALARVADRAWTLLA